MNEQTVTAPGKKGEPRHKKADKTMPLTEHLREVRRRIFCVALVYLVLVVVCFTFIEKLVVPLLSMSGNFNFVYLSPSELIMCYMRLSLIFALIAALPMIGYHLWAFFLPALTKKEKKVMLAGILTGFAFFALGVYFSYRVVLPFTLKFLASYNSLDMIASSISVDSYTRFVMNLLLIFGVIFEMPVLSAILSGLGILKAEILIKFRKYAVLFIFVLAAIITPPDVVSQAMVAIPMVLLYQISIYICRTTARVKEKNRSAMEEIP